MGILDDAIRQHLDLKRQHGAEEDEVKQLEDEAFGPPSRQGETDFREKAGEGEEASGAEGAVATEAPAKEGAETASPVAESAAPPVEAESAAPPVEAEVAEPPAEEPPAPEPTPEPEPVPEPEPEPE